MVCVCEIGYFFGFLAACAAGDFLNLCSGRCFCRKRWLAFKSLIVGKYFAPIAPRAAAMPITGNQNFTSGRSPRDETSFVGAPHDHRAQPLSNMIKRTHFLVLVFSLLAGCASDPASARKSAVEQEIRAKIASVREAIMAKDAAGIFRNGTADWTFTGPDGVTLDRERYLVRTEALFARIITIESLQTTVDRVDISSADLAEIELTQIMVRSERAPQTGEISRLNLRYREQHRWIRTADGWRIQKVTFIGTPERTVLPVRGESTAPTL